MNRIERMSVFCKTLNPILTSLVLFFGFLVLLMFFLSGNYIGVKIGGLLTTQPL
jgi:hypothetical protein